MSGNAADCSRCGWTARRPRSTPTVLSPTALTPAQDANATWTSAIAVQVVSASSGEKTPDTPCAAADQQRITSLQFTFDVGTATVPIPSGLTTCQAQLGLGITRR